MRYLVSYTFLVFLVVHVQTGLGLSRRTTDLIRATPGNVQRLRRTGSSIYTTGMVSIGLRAMNKLLKGARELPGIDMTYRDFVKPGGYDQALLDFHAVTKKYAGSKFAKFKSQSETMSAEVGDRFIFLRNRGEYGRPEIEIMRFKSDRQMGREFTGDRIDRITYKD